MNMLSCLQSSFWICKFLSPPSIICSIYFFDCSSIYLWSSVIIGLWKLQTLHCIVYSFVFHRMNYKYRIRIQKIERMEIQFHSIENNIIRRIKKICNIKISIKTAFRLPFLGVSPMIAKRHKFVSKLIISYHVSNSVVKLEISQAHSVFINHQCFSSMW